MANLYLELLGGELNNSLSNVSQEYRKLKNYLLHLKSEDKSKSTSLTKDSFNKYKNNGEEKVLDKRGEIMVYFGKNFSIHAEYITKFFSENKIKKGLVSKLKINVHSKNPEEAIRVSFKLQNLLPELEPYSKDKFSLDYYGDEKFNSQSDLI